MDIINIAGGQKPSLINNAKGEGTACLPCRGKKTQKERSGGEGSALRNAVLRMGFTFPALFWFDFFVGGDPLLTKAHVLVKVELAAV